MGTALVTGASSGLGVDYAKLFAADKHDLVLVARRRDRLDQLAAELTAAHGVKVLVIAADLQEAAAPRQIFDEVQKAGLELEFLVNNAGFGSTGPFVESELAKELGQVQVNISALVALTWLFLPGMVKRGKGRVLNIGSTAGFQPGPYMATYYASKAFVNSFTEALSYELKGTGVTATASCPGATATEFALAAGNADSRLFRMGKMSSAEVARAGYDAMLAGTPIQVHGLKNHLMLAGTWLIPRGLARTFAARFNRSPGH